MALQVDFHPCFEGPAVRLPAPSSRSRAPRLLARRPSTCWEEEQPPPPPLSPAWLGRLGPAALALLGLAAAAALLLSQLLHMPARGPVVI